MFHTYRFLVISLSVFRECLLVFVSFIMVCIYSESVEIILHCLMPYCLFVFSTCMYCVNTIVLFLLAPSECSNVSGLSTSSITTEAITGHVSNAATSKPTTYKSTVASTLFASSGPGRVSTTRPKSSVLTRTTTKWVPTRPTHSIPTVLPVVDKEHNMLSSILIVVCVAIAAVVVILGAVLSVIYKVLRVQAGHTDRLVTVLERRFIYRAADPLIADVGPPMQQVDNRKAVKNIACGRSMASSSSASTIFLAPEKVPEQAKVKNPEDGKVNMACSAVELLAQKLPLNESSNSETPLLNISYDVIKDKPQSSPIASRTRGQRPKTEDDTSL